MIVVQEWWGLNENIRDIARRFAGEGFAALAPDLYRGRQTTEPDEARKLVMELDADRAVGDLRAALDWLKAQGATEVAATGFCMGGRLVWRMAFTEPRLAAAVPFYGMPSVKGELHVPVLAHFGEEDHSIPLRDVGDLDRFMTEQGIPHEFHVYEGAPHAFFNDTRPSYRPEAARLAWERTITFLRKHLANAS